MSQRIHLLVSLLLGIILVLSAATGLVLSSTSLSQSLQAGSVQNENVATVAERIAQQWPGVERIERAPNGELRVSVSTDQGNDEWLVNPSSGQIIAPYQPSATLAWIRDLHRELLLGASGRWLSALSALALLALSISGCWLLARRLGGWHRLLQPITGQGLSHWHSVVARWALPVLLILAVSGLYLAGTSQGWINDGQDTELAYPQTDTSTVAPLGSLSALRGVALNDLRELEFPSDHDTANYYSVHTATGEGFVNASSGQWINYQPHNLARRVYDAVYILHTGADSALWSLMLAAASLACLGLGGTGIFAWWQRRRLGKSTQYNAPAAQADLLILVGSQGGSTWDYAHQLQSQLAASGMRVHSASMNQLKARYPQAKYLLLMTSTYGDGQAPESASAFLQRFELCQLPADVQVAVLGFGDRQFQHFCGYAKQVSHQLQQRGMRLLLPFHTIDRGNAAELNHWAQYLSEALGISLQLTPAHSRLPLQPLTLLSKQVYGEPGEAPAAILRFAMTNGQPGERFAPGDLLAISPGNGQVPRYYSIASSDADGALEICVRKQPQGLCSSMLHGLPVGDSVLGFVQAHPDFRPNAGQHPLILVGAGTGLAPLVGFVRKNAPCRPLHLYWGGRHPQADFPYKDDLHDYLVDGRLTQLGLAFSQGAEGQYVQDRLQQDSGDLQHLLAAGAQVLVCGSRHMAAGVRAVLESVLAPLGSSVEQLRLQGRYREDVY